jgi:hypothetical protein
MVVRMAKQNTGRGQRQEDRKTEDRDKRTERQDRDKRTGQSEDRTQVSHHENGHDSHSYIFSYKHTEMTQER